MYLPFLIFAILCILIVPFALLAIKRKAVSIILAGICVVASVVNFEAAVVFPEKEGNIRKIIKNQYVLYGNSIIHVKELDFIIYQKNLDLIEYNKANRKWTIILSDKEKVEQLKERLNQEYDNATVEGAEVETT